MNESLANMRHSLAHILAHAVQDLYSDVKFGVGPVIDNGFYYDFDLDDTISEDDLERIEQRMREIIKADYSFEREELSLADAKTKSESQGQPYKTELIKDLLEKGTTEAYAEADGEAETVDSATFYTIGEFTDLCRGSHVDSTSQVGVFALTRVSGAYWRGDENNSQMQRIYGVAFETQDELESYLKMQEEAKERDHRKLGKELDLFTFSDLVGSGLPLFTPRGTVVKNLLTRYSQQLREQAGFMAVSIPHITKQELYKRSGHWDKFGDELFLVTSQETSDKMALKPMNCPHHTQIYASQQRSYRDLPLMYLENTVQYRDEKSGELHGLSRVRSISIDDNHAFVTEEQIQEVANRILHAVKQMYDTLDMELSFDLSFRDDSKGYLGDDDLWEKSQNILTELAEQNNLNYTVEEGEAAFYGPKIDFIATDALARKWQVATLQLDFVQPERFELEYIDSNGEAQTPVLIHAALLGSAERFMSVYLEHTNGHFPFWLAPEQVRVIPVNDKIDDYITTISDNISDVVLMQPLKYNELRYSVDSSSESLGKRIYRAEKEKVPVIIIAGPRDQKQKQISLRINGEESTVQLSQLVKTLQAIK
jgi:threonyl-tRNA synthetase